MDRPPTPDSSRPPASDELTLSHVTERDVDLVLVEELRASSEFTALVIRRALAGTGAPVERPPTETRVQHSLTRSGEASGETDVALRVKWGQESALVHIENKIDAPFQERQPERYAEEAARAVSDGEARYATTLLVAPGEYLEATEEGAKFDATLSYEEVSRHLSARAEGFAAGDVLARELGSACGFAATLWSRRSTSTDVATRRRSTRA
jgi:hypothetical protein